MEIIHFLLEEIDDLTLLITVLTQRSIKKENREPELKWNHYVYRRRLEAKVLEICKTNLQWVMIRVYLGEKGRTEQEREMEYLWNDGKMNLNGTK